MLEAMPAADAKEGGCYNVFGWLVLLVGKES